MNKTKKKSALKLVKPGARPRSAVKAVRIVVPEILAADKLLSSHECAGLIQVNPSSINKWVKEDRITAFRTPGGHRRIRASDFVSFLTKCGMPIPRALEDVRKSLEPATK